MLRYMVHRLLVMVPTLVAISMIVFVIIQLPPGDYLTTMIAELQSQGEGVQQRARSTTCASCTASTSRSGSSTLYWAWRPAARRSRLFVRV